MKRVARCTVRRVVAGAPGDAGTDTVVVEEPLEIRVAGEPLATTMRTPGEDAALALGFLFAEGVITSAADVGSVAHCGRPGDEGYGNVIDVLPGPGIALDPDRLASSRRGTLTTSACGVCGRRSIEDLLARAGPLPPGAAVSLALVVSSTERLREVQPTFDRTGAIHAAAALDGSGALLAAAEDVGRHNAVDKVVGALLRADRLGAAAVLVVSGRISFEIVQKAAVARIGVVTGVSAPTSLAVDLAHRLGLSLAGFVRGGGLNVYAHEERISELRDRPGRPVLGVLVGGASRRMGGRPKGRLAHPAGGSLLEAIVRAGLDAGMEPVLVGQAEPYADLLPEVPRLEDAPAGIGPLGGLSAALRYAGDRDVVTVACDMPGVTPQVLRRIAGHPSEAPVLAARRGERWEPMLARWRGPRLRAHLDRAIGEGIRSFQRLIREAGAEVLPLDPELEGALVDWDTPDEVGRRP